MKLLQPVYVIWKTFLDYGMAVRKNGSTLQGLTGIDRH